MEEIFRSDKVLQFWPTSKQTVKERVYSTTRFILYTACILYLIRRDVRILIMAAVALGGLFYMYKNGMISKPEMVLFNQTTKDNIMNNGLESGPPDKLSIKAAWDKVHPFKEGRWFAEHNFYTVPGNDNEEFIENTYSSMMVPRCRDDPAFCNPDSNMARGPEWIQRKTFERL